MKEITREDWIESPTPRMMWVWDDFESQKEKHLVIHCFTKEGARCSFLAENDDGLTVTYWMHCAEITEDEGGTPLNDYELGQLFRCMGVEWKMLGSVFINEMWDYVEGKEDELPIPDSVKIRYRRGEWEEPTRETVRKWATLNSDFVRFISFMGWQDKAAE